MHDDAEATGNFSDQARQIGSPAAGGRLLDEAHDFRRDLARSMRAAFDWQQANQTAAIEIPPELVKCRPGYTEQLGGLRDRPALGSHTSKHLVSNLDQITRVEEFTVDKSRVSNIFCVSIGSATALERGQLGVWFW
jgi:hypothetical protein